MTRVSPVFAGRDLELRLLERALDEASETGTVRTVLLGAEAGGGKTRLIQELSARVRDRALVLQGGCVAQWEAALPYAPITAIVRELVRHGGAEQFLATVGDGDAGDLAHLLPEFGAPRAVADPELARARLFEVLRRVFERLGALRSTVVVIEDGHWADAATRDFLSFLSGNLRRAALLIIVSYRTDQLHETHELRPLLAEMTRRPGVTSIRLDRLGRRDVATQIEGILGNPPSPGVLDLVYARGEGVPLFTEVLLGDPARPGASLPGSFRDLLLRVVRDLPEITGSVLRFASVGGSAVRHELLARVTGHASERLTEILRPAVAANVIVDDGDGYRFRHELIREAVEGTLLGAEAAAVHRAYAEALEAAPALVSGSWLPLAVARHWRSAHDHRRALAAAWRAAADAESRLAYREQLEMLEQVLALWPQVPDAEQVIGTERLAVVERAADAACWTAEPERGLVHAESALAELREDRHGPRVAAMLLQRAVMRHQRLDPGELDDLRHALRLCERPDQLRAETLGQLARALLRQGRYDEAEPLASELEKLGETLRDDEYRIEARIVRAQLDAVSEDTAPALIEASEAARLLGSGRLEVIAYAALLSVLDRRGDHAQAAHVGRAALARTRLVGQGRYMGATIAAHLAAALAAIGRWDEAGETLSEAFDVDPSPSARAPLLTLAALIAIGRGELDRAERLVHELRLLLPAPETAVSLALVEIELLLARGDPVGAEQVAASVPRREPREDGHLQWPLLVAALRVAALRAHAEAGTHAGLGSELEVLAGRLPRDGPVERAYAATFDAELARAGGRSDPARWDAVADLWGTLGHAWRRSHALMRAGSALAAEGDRTGAARRFAESRILASALGAVPRLGELDALSRRAGLQQTCEGGQPAPSGNPAGLTQREFAVLRLVAAGRTNREIAAELFISPKTASVHVSNILAKLEVPNRGAAAAAAHRLRLVEPS